MKKEELILKYKKSLAETKGIFESLESEFKYVLENHKWILNEKIEKFTIFENGKYFVFGEGNVALISEELITNYNPIFEDSNEEGIFTKITKFLTSGLTHAWDLVTNNTGFSLTKITLMIAGVSELLSIFLSIIPTPLVVSIAGILAVIPIVGQAVVGTASLLVLLDVIGKVLGIVAGVAFLVGGVSQLIESQTASKDEVYNVHEAEKEALKESVINEGAVPYNSPTFENGFTHFVMGIVSLSLGFVLGLLSKGASTSLTTVIKTAVKRFFSFFTKRGFKYVSIMAKRAIKSNNVKIRTFLKTGVRKGIRDKADDVVKHALHTNAKDLTNAQIKSTLKDNLKKTASHSLKHSAEHGLKHVAQASSVTNIGQGITAVSKWSITFVAALGFFFKDLFKNHKAVNEDFTSSFGNNILKIIKGFNGTVGPILNKIKESFSKMKETIENASFELPWVPESIEQSVKKYSVSAFSKIVEMVNTIVSKIAGIVKFFDECLESVLLSVDVYNENNFESADFGKEVETIRGTITKDSNKNYETLNKAKERIKTLGKISFDSNKSEKKTDENGTEYLVVTDIKTSKKYGVIRNSDGTYKFKKKNKEKKNESFVDFEKFKMLNEMKNNTENEKPFKNFVSFNNELLEKEKMNEGIGTTIYNWSAEAKSKIQLAFFVLADKLADKIFSNSKGDLKAILDGVVKRLEPSLSVEENNILKSSIKDIKDRIQSGEIAKGGDVGKAIDKALGFKI